MLLKPSRQNSLGTCIPIIEEPNSPQYKHDIEDISFPQRACIPIIKEPNSPQYVHDIEDITFSLGACILIIKEPNSPQYIHNMEYPFFHKLYQQRQKLCETFCHQPLKPFHLSSYFRFFSFLILYCFSFHSHSMSHCLSIVPFLLPLLLTTSPTNALSTVLLLCLYYICL